MNVFNGQILAEKLSKLNNSQQSIETLSHWCIFHRKKAKQIVETWDKVFNSSQKEQRVSFLYLANDILQNSRRKGSEFVNEFWKVLPSGLKDVYENGEDHGKKAVSRLVDIWEERKVFGSRGRSLKDEMLSKDPPPSLENNGKNSSSNSIKIVRKDAHSIRIKLAVGGMPEKIVTAFQSVHDEHFNEDTALNKCKAAVRRVGKMEKEVDSACTQGTQQGLTLAEELEEQENVLRQCIEKLESVEKTRMGLISKLKEAVQDQESKLELIRTELQVGLAQIEQASNMRQRLTLAPVPNTTTTTTTTTTTISAEPTTIIELNPSLINPSSIILPTSSTQTTSFAASKATTEEEHKKAAAAAVAAKLAASTSSAQMLTSILSSLAAEEAASRNDGVKPPSFSTTLPIFLPEKRPKLEKPGNSTYFSHVQQSHFPPPPPPLPLVPPPAPQYAQSSSSMVGVMPYGYGSNTLPPPPPLPTHIVMGLARPATQPQKQAPAQPQPQPQPQQQQSPSTGGYYQSPGVGFYGQNHQPSTPPVPRQ